jgi:hypothetical protein
MIRDQNMRFMAISFGAWRGEVTAIRVRIPSNEVLVAVVMVPGRSTGETARLCKCARRWFGWPPSIGEVRTSFELGYLGVSEVLPGLPGADWPTLSTYRFQ